MRLALSKFMLSLTLGWTAFAVAKEAPLHEIKKETLQSLQELRKANVKRLMEIDQTLSVKLEETKPGNLEKDVMTLRTAKREHALRQEFLDRLILQVDKNYRGGDLRLFLQMALTEMAKTDAMNASSDTGLWKFLKFAADAVRSLPERKENILGFLEGYMNRSVSNPIKPEDYLNSRNYTNGSVSEQGNPVDRDQVGEVAEQRLQELGDSAPEPAVKSTIPAPKEIKTQ